MIQVQPTENIPIRSIDDISESRDISDEELGATLSDIDYYSDHPGELVYYSDLDDLFGHLRRLFHSKAQARENING